MQRPTITKKNKHIIRSPNSVPIEPKKTSFKEIEKNYTLVEGNFNLEGTWQCDLVPEASGSLFFQVIFLKMEADIKEEFEIISKLKKIKFLAKSEFYFKIFKNF